MIFRLLLPLILMTAAPAFAEEVVPSNEISFFGRLFAGNSGGIQWLGVGYRRSWFEAQVYYAYGGGFPVVGQILARKDIGANRWIIPFIQGGFLINSGLEVVVGAGIEPVIPIGGSRIGIRLDFNATTVGTRGLSIRLIPSLGASWHF